MADEIFMDVPAVKEIANKFGGVGDQLKTTSNAIQAAILMLKASAFVGLVGSQAVVAYLENLKPQIDNYAAACSEMRTDLTASAEAYERGDAAGATRFH